MSKQRSQPDELGDVETPSMKIVHVIAKFLNGIGVGNSTTVAAVHKHVKSQLGAVPEHVDRWLEQQRGGDPIGGIEIKRPKISIDGSGNIKVLRLYRSKSKN